MAQNDKKKSVSLRISGTAHHMLEIFDNDDDDDDDDDDGDDQLLLWYD